MAVVLGGETVEKNAAEIFRGDAHAVVADLEDDAVVRVRRADHELLLGLRGSFARLPRVIDEIDQNLQRLVLLDLERRVTLALLEDPDVVMKERTGIHAERFKVEKNK